MVLVADAHQSEWSFPRDLQLRRALQDSKKRKWAQLSIEDFVGFGETTLRRLIPGFMFDGQPSSCPCHLGAVVALDHALRASRPKHDSFRCSETPSQLDCDW